MLRSKAWLLGPLLSAVLLWPLLRSAAALDRRFETAAGGIVGHRTHAGLFLLYGLYAAVPAVLSSLLATRYRRGSLAVVVAVALVASGCELVVSIAPAPVRYAGSLYSGGTHGDLAGDASYAARVLKAWDASHWASANADSGVFDDLRGRARVVWAGKTPAGNAALVMQEAYLHQHGNLQLAHAGIYDVVGFVGTGAGGSPVVVGDAYAGEDFIENAWFVDPGRTVLAVADNGERYGISPGWRYGPEGSVGRDYQPIADHDGVGITRLTTSAAGVHVARLPYTDVADLRRVAAAVPPRTDDRGLMLPWRTTVTLPGAVRAEGLPVTTLLRAIGATVRGQAYSLTGGSWSVRGRTPDGRQFVAGEILLENDPSHAYVLLSDGNHGSKDVLYQGGLVDLRGPLPVAVRLPDRQGWVVASPGRTLRYRTGSAAWKPAGHDGALLPSAATSVEVTGSGGRPVVVPLTTRLTLPRS